MSKHRLLTILGLVLAIILAGCDLGGGQPAPTPTSQTQSTTVVNSTPTGEPPAASNTPAPAATDTAAPAQPTATRAQSISDKGEALTLNPMPVETNDATRIGIFEEERIVNLRPGFHINVYAVGLPGVRWLGLPPDNKVYATVRGDGRVVILPDDNGDGVADQIINFADGLGGVHGIAFKDNGVYVATETQIIRLEDTDGDNVADKREELANDLPGGGGHSTRTIAFGPDGKLYVSVGSSCNVCIEENPKRAAISLYSAEGKFEKVYAKGLRNAVGILFHPITGELWATNNGRDQIGDDLPPESIYKVKDGGDYGWPNCYGDRVPDATRNVPPGYCEQTELPEVNMQAHSAPLGLAFYTGEQFPPQFHGDMFVGFHGSWNRSTPTGYKVVRIRMKDNQVDKSNPDLVVEDFATGWLLGRQAWGRPVNPMVAPDGSLLLTDDATDAIYRIYYQENAGP